MRTPLFDTHMRLHARIVDFHGWEMPVWYTGIIEEHLATRNAAGLFDVSHMGEILVSGKLSTAYLDRVLAIDIPALPEGKVKYALLLNQAAGIIDDLLVYCLEPGARYMLCVNAANIGKDYAWLVSQNAEGVELADKSNQTAMLALQGPDAGKILRSCLSFALESVRRFQFILTDTHYGRLMISRTGYTGSDGVEIFMEPSQINRLWETFVAAGATPCGLGARDTLRLEMGYPLQGNDMDENTTPFEAGLGLAIHMEKPCFIGKEALARQREKGIKRRLTGLVMMDKGIPRQGFLCIQDSQVGMITSGSISPVLNTGIALAYLDASVQEGEVLDVLIRSKAAKARVTQPPFVKTGLIKSV